MFMKDFYYLGKIWRNPRKQSKEMRAFQLKKLRSVVSHAYCNSPFYHEKLRKAGISPDDICSLEDISKIPTTTKDELKRAFREAVAKNIPPGKQCTITTSGTSGKKLEIVHSRDFMSLNAAVFYRMYWSLGMRPFKRVSYIRYHPLNDTVLYTTAEKYFFEKLRVSPPHYISTFMDVNTQLELVVRQKPHVLVGHPPDIAALARAARAAGEKLELDFIVSNSELLVKREREYIEETFHCPVYNEYSTLEVGYIAHDCRKKRMHMVEDSVLTEFLKDGESAAPGEQGDVVVTLLFENAMPFIRYNQGDVASYTEETCDCGSNFSLMNVIEGRVDDFIVLPSGKEISPTHIVPTFFDFETVREFNIIQTAPDRVIVSIVPTPQFGKKEEETLRDLIQRELPGMGIEINYVETIEKTPAGKKRAVTNLVKRT